jgi:CDP-4-dehydro-6-deoxyglucose reductase
MERRSPGARRTTGGEVGRQPRIDGLRRIHGDGPPRRVVKLAMPQPIRVRLVEREPIADGVVDVRLDLVEPAEIQFRPGQFMTLPVGKDASGHDHRRSYSIASLPDQLRSLRFIIRILTHGLASDFWKSLPVGAEVEMTGPHGFFTLEPQHSGDVVFAATGTGLAPLFPMLAELSQRRQEALRRDVYWGLRQEKDLFLADEVTAACARAGARLHTYLSRPTDGWTGLRGRITTPVLEAVASLHDPTFYIVGNGAMIAELKRSLIDRGVDRKKHIRTEAFFD